MQLIRPLPDIVAIGLKAGEPVKGKIKDPRQGNSHFPYNIVPITITIKNIGLFDVTTPFPVTAMFTRHAPLYYPVAFQIDSSFNLYATVPSLKKMRR